MGQYLNYTESGNSTLRHNSGTDVAVDRLALDTELPLQRAHALLLSLAPRPLEKGSGKTAIPELFWLAKILLAR